MNKPCSCQLKVSQKALLAARKAFDPDIIIAAKLRKGTRTDLGYGTDETYIRTAQLAAELFGISRQTVAFGIYVLRYGCQKLIDEVQAGNMAISVAAKIAKMDISHQYKLIGMPKKDRTAYLKMNDDHIKYLNKRTIYQMEDNQITDFYEVENSNKFRHMHEIIP